MADTNNGEGILLAELLRDGPTRWDVYKDRCAELRIPENRLNLIGAVEFSEKRMTERKHEGRGCVTEPEVAGDSIVRLTGEGKRVARIVRSVLAIFCDNPLQDPDPELSVSSKSRRREFEPFKVVPQRSMFPPVD